MNGMFVKVLADTVSPAGDRITTFHLRYPRFLHPQILRYRLAAHNVRSSRAVPTAALLKEVLDEPVAPNEWPKNCRGMSPKAYLEGWHATAADVVWRVLSFNAVVGSRVLSAIGVHKEWANRPMEPWMFVDDIMTATDVSHGKDTWMNMIKQRTGKNGAQGPVVTLVEGIACALQYSVPNIALVHLPYHTADLTEEEAPAVCAARVARISYAPWDTRVIDKQRDLKLAAELRQKGHMSPFEHVAFANPGAQSGCMYGWKTQRDIYENID